MVHGGAARLGDLVACRARETPEWRRLCCLALVFTSIRGVSSSSRPPEAPAPEEEAVRRIERGRRLGWGAGLAHLVALGPPGFCLYAWVTGSPMRFEDPGLTVCLHVAVVVSAVATANIGGIHRLRLRHEGAQSLGSGGWRQNLAADWWQRALLWVPFALALVALVRSGAALMLDPTGVQIEPGSSLLTWLLVLVSAFVLPSLLQVSESWLVSEGLRTSTFTTVRWADIWGFVREDTRFSIYLRGSLGVPHSVLVVSEAQVLAEALGHAGVDAWFEHPRAFLLQRIFVALAAVGLIACGVAADQVLAFDPRLSFIGLVVLAVGLTWLFERTRGLDRTVTASLPVETEDEHWLRTRAELGGLLLDWREGRATRAEVHAWARELLESHGRLDQEIHSGARVLLAELLSLLAAGEMGAVAFGDVDTLARALAQPPGEEDAAVEDDGVAGASLDPSALRDLLIGWGAEEVDDAALDAAFLGLISAEPLGVFPDCDARSIPIEIATRLFPSAYRDVLPEDAAACLAFLDGSASPVSAWRAWTQYWRGLDEIERRARMTYKPFSSGDTTRIAARARLESLLRRWTDGELRPETVQERALELVVRSGVLFCPPDDPACVRHELCMLLANLETRLLTPDDVPLMRLALAEADGVNAAAALRRLCSGLGGIDFVARVAELRDHPAYSTVAKRRELRRLGLLPADASASR